MSRILQDEAPEPLHQPLSKLSFLDLPADIRCLVYKKAGLLIGNIVDFDREDPEDYDYSDIRDPHEYSSTYNLLLASRAIYTDVMPIIYSSNTFVLRRRHVFSFEPFLNLAPESLACLVHLIICLNLAHSTCHCDKNRWIRNSSGPHGLLGHASHSDQAVIAEWQQIAARLASAIQPHRLSFKLICDAADYESAKVVLAPFERFPPLKACEVRIGPHPTAELSQLAEETALSSLRDRDPRRIRSSQPFPFDCLPKELQIQVFCFSNLISLCEIEWLPGRGFTLRYPQSCHSLSGCCCPRNHAAFSDDCWCWLPPSALFLVNRAVRQIALEIFYSRNRFIIRTYSEFLPPLLRSGRTELSLFLKNTMPQSAIYYLRSIHIGLSPFHGTHSHLNSTAFKDWLSTISYLKKHANLPTLTVKIKMEDDYEGQHFFMFLARLSNAHTEEACEMYALMLASLAELNGLKDLFISLPYRICSDFESDIRNSPLRRHEQAFERRIMGAEYDSGARGKDEWLRDWYYDVYRRLN